MICAISSKIDRNLVALAIVAVLCTLPIRAEQARAHVDLDTLPVTLPVTLADILPPGQRGILHKLEFVDSDPLATHRLVAAPIRGFQGVEEVQPGNPFPFSTKYGTRFYVVPKDAALPEKINQETMAAWPSCGPPVKEIRSVPWYSPVDSVLSTCKLVDVSSDSIRVELVAHVELDANGQPAGKFRPTWILGSVAVVGILACGGIYLRRRSRLGKSVQEDHQAP